MANGTYKCAHCGEEYEYLDDTEWSDADAAAEREQNFPGVPATECDVVCDDCYQKLMARWAAPRN